MLQINTNPDLDDYKESVIAGMTAKETLWAGAGLLAGSAASILLHMFLHIPLFLCIYAAIPVSIPFILTGFSIKDGMTYWQRRRQHYVIYQPSAGVSIRTLKEEQRKINRSRIRKKNLLSY